MDRHHHQHPHYQRDAQAVDVGALLSHGLASGLELHVYPPGLARAITLPGALLVLVLVLVGHIGLGLGFGLLLLPLLAILLHPLLLVLFCISVVVVIQEVRVDAGLAGEEGLDRGARQGDEHHDDAVALLAHAVEEPVEVDEAERDHHGALKHQQSPHDRCDQVRMVDGVVDGELHDLLQRLDHGVGVVVEEEEKVRGEHGVRVVVEGRGHHAPRADHLSKELPHVDFGLNKLSTRAVEGVLITHGDMGRVEEAPLDLARHRGPI
mmetsp:Transcript_29208/g.93342  ORF Transcript_29208/g.93342 Transcript_29208/m.93342 type:complete len:265 (+) Transcript_29208:1156-1950(+)